MIMTGAIQGLTHSDVTLMVMGPEIIPTMKTMTALQMVSSGVRITEDHPDGVILWELIQTGTVFQTEEKLTVIL